MCHPAAYLKRILWPTRPNLCAAVINICYMSRTMAHFEVAFAGGRDSPLGQCGRSKILVET